MNARYWLGAVVVAATCAARPAAAEQSKSTAVATVAAVADRTRRPPVKACAEAPGAAPASVSDVTLVFAGTTTRLTGAEWWPVTGTSRAPGSGPGRGFSFPVHAPRSTWQSLVDTVARRHDVTQVDWSSAAYPLFGHVHATTIRTASMVR